ncbi:unnamed protein product [Brassica napus]|uniref:(rape) hypothetical protein n=1 Tax=Brassica napus TaxID=3708 RepID=A0A816RZZ5_BRANA|nr:unnamed protein product [Brassica napus]
MVERRRLDFFSGFKFHGDLKTNDMATWNHPSSVLESMSSLQKFNWLRHVGRSQDRDICGCILNISMVDVQVESPSTEFPDDFYS